VGKAQVVELSGDAIALLQFMVSDEVAAMRLREREELPEAGFTIATLDNLASVLNHASRLHVTLDEEGSLKMEAGK
jgi:hypothetical protein